MLVKGGEMFKTLALFITCASAVNLELNRPSLNVLGEFNKPVLNVLGEFSRPSLKVLGGCYNEINLLDSLLDKNKLVESPGFSEGKNYRPGTSCKWLVESPNNTKVELNCEVDIPKTGDCSTDGLHVSTSGDLNFKDGSVRCGSTSFTLVSEYNKIGIELLSDKTSKGGKFSCKLRAVGAKRARAVSTSGCNCGWSNRVRIVNGSPTGVNQYIFMAGIVDLVTKSIVCGGTLISNKYVLTAAHCIRNLDTTNTAVVLGEHDTSTGSDTSATILARIRSFKTYPYYDSVNKKYDLALIELTTAVPFSTRVGPACLPFSSSNWDLTGQVVTVLGWGTIEYGGPRSQVLLQANLNLVDVQECVDNLGGNIEGYTQYCSLTPNTDACQYDSGGPLVWINPNTNRYQIVGIISYGRGCAFGYPSVNTRVAPFLQWILDNTPGENYCAL